MRLNGKRIVVTRAPHQADSLARLITDVGAVPILYPCIDIAPPADTRPLDDALRELSAFGWLIITSQNTVYALAERLHILGISPDWSQLNIAAVGTSTAEIVREVFGAEVALIPQPQTAEALANALKIVPCERVFLPQSARATDDLAKRLAQMGFIVTTATAYDNVIGQGGADVPAMLDAGQIDAITFTSASTVDRFAERLSPRAVPVELPVACIGSSTAEAAHRHGYHTVITPDTFALSDMLDALAGWFG
ncbi:MAG: uroporphyrinogen-III synthase [Aggregatilineales bacterium]